MEENWSFLLITVPGLMPGLPTQALHFPAMATTLLLVAVDRLLIEASSPGKAHGRELQTVISRRSLTSQTRRNLPESHYVHDGSLPLMAAQPVRVGVSTAFL